MKRDQRDAVLQATAGLMTINGGSAYPHKYADVPGMTLRDYFAAAALTGGLLDGAFPTPEDAAISAYEYADAMLTAREGREA